MQKRKLCDTGLEVSAIGLGCMGAVTRTGCSHAVETLHHHPVGAVLQQQDDFGQPLELFPEPSR